MELKTIKGIGNKRLEHLNHNGIHTIKGLVSTFPKRYNIKYLSHLEDASNETYTYYQGKILEKPTIYFIRNNLSKLSFPMDFEGKTITVSVFNQKFLLRSLFQYSNVVVYGKFNDQFNALQAQKVYLLKNFKEGYEPVYNLASINDKTFLKLVHESLNALNTIQDPLPKNLVNKHHLMQYNDLLNKVHTPKNHSEYEAIMKRLKYQELLIHQVKMQYAKYIEKSAHKTKKAFDSLLIDAFINSLPFSLTDGQMTTIDTLLNDLKSESSMYRLLQGDTGSGKTVVALISAYAVVLSGYQVAFMAPTEILARQHFKTFKDFLKGLDLNVSYLSNSLPLDKIRSTQHQLKQGEIDVVVGTHKLFSKDTTYANLGLSITDEQHRFGVNQRKSLKEKGQGVESLYLSATPIPRTLGKTLYGNMDISIINERPLKREFTKTKAIPHQHQSVILNRLKNVFNKEEQIYVVAPNIETTDTFPNSVNALYKKFTSHFPTKTIKKLHGKMPKETQDNTLMTFKRGGIDILIATTIIEVGIDIPNATTMLIYHSEKFGFSQLHQLRGRVGRGKKQGACILFYTPSDVAKKRMKIMEDTTDGFVLSEYDLKYRGQGDLIGTLQSGYLPFRYVSFPDDHPLLEEVTLDAKEVVSGIIKNDPTYLTMKNIINQNFSSD